MLHALTLQTTWCAKVPAKKDVAKPNKGMPLAPSKLAEIYDFTALTALTKCSEIDDPTGDTLVRPMCSDPDNLTKCAKDNLIHTRTTATLMATYTKDQGKMHHLDLMLHE